MSRHLFFTIALLGSAVLLISRAEARTAAQCEEQGLNCEDRCPDITGGAGDYRERQNKCDQSCARRVNACLIAAHAHPVVGIDRRRNFSVWR
jgi:hypothetical protein